LKKPIFILLGKSQMRRLVSVRWRGLRCRVPVSWAEDPGAVACLGANPGGSGRRVLLAEGLANGRACLEDVVARCCGLRFDLKNLSRVHVGTGLVWGDESRNSNHAPRGIYPYASYSLSRCSGVIGIATTSGLFHRSLLAVRRPLGVATRVSASPSIVGSAWCRWRRATPVFDCASRVKMYLLSFS